MVEWMLLVHTSMVFDQPWVKREEDMATEGKEDNNETKVGHGKMSITTMINIFNGRGEKLEMVIHVLAYLNINTSLLQGIQERGG